MKYVKIALMMFGLFFLTGCYLEKSSIELPDGIPKYVQESDFNKVDWGNKAEDLGSNMLGKKGLFAVIGADMSSVNINQKWMWLLWGIKDPLQTEITVVGFHKDSKEVHQVIPQGWSMSLAGEIYDVDAHMVSSVNFPEGGEWALLVYANGEFFGQLVYEIVE